MYNLIKYYNTYYINIYIIRNKLTIFVNNLYYIYYIIYISIYILLIIYIYNIHILFQFFFF